MKTGAVGTVLALCFLVPASLAEAQTAAESWIESEEIQSPQYFAVRVSEVSEAAAWYRKVFNLEDAGGSEAEDGSWEIMNLRNRNLFVEVVRDDRAEEVGRYRGFYKVGFFVADVRIIADRIARAGGERPQVLGFEGFGVRIIQLRDPDGNIIQLFSQLE